MEDRRMEDVNWPGAKERGKTGPLPCGLAALQKSSPHILKVIMGGATASYLSFLCNSRVTSFGRYHGERAVICIDHHSSKDISRLNTAMHSAASQPGAPGDHASSGSARTVFNMGFRNRSLRPAQSLFGPSPSLCTRDSTFGAGATGDIG